MFTLRFDMRAPEGAAPATDLYAAAIDMCAWAETRGAVIAVLSEHHGTHDGHLPAPHILAAAIAARTKQLAILLAAVPVTFWDPVRLAEEVSVLDIISKGRVSYAFGIGHRAEEYEHFGIDMHQRGKLADESLALLRRLLQGKPVDHGGRRNLLHDAVTAASYRHGDDSVASISRADSVSALHETEGPSRIFTVDEASSYIRNGKPLPLLPLCGGVPPEVAWPYLERAVTATERA